MATIDTDYRISLQWRDSGMSAVAVPFYPDGCPRDPDDGVRDVDAVCPDCRGGWSVDYRVSESARVVARPCGSEL
ncbi:hypothetical protein [Frankia sp. CiP3]|uniref:hypothetical protein n=1 Tax=Frankia sp. CiP3 TaxID=2880971 RepID=UPI001EF5919C|nr:hypothetical protein [Frankia sp. CiP3]